MLTVKQYAESRGVSDTTVKNHIRKLALDLPENPTDRRQRLLSNDHQLALDESLGVSPIAQPITPEVIPYERGEAVGMVLAQNSLNPISYEITRPEDNPLFQALQNQVAALEQYNTQAYDALHHQTTAYRDADAAISAIEKLQIAQRARQKAFEHHSLEQQLYNQSLTELRMASQGLHAPTQATAPAAQPQQPTASNPDWL